MRKVAVTAVLSEAQSSCDELALDSWRAQATIAAMTSDDQIRAGIPRAVQVLSAWLEADTPNSSAAFAEEQLRTIISEGQQAQSELVIGLVVAAGTLLNDLSVATEDDQRQLLQGLAMRFQPPSNPA